MMDISSIGYYLVPIYCNKNLFVWISLTAILPIKSFFTDLLYFLFCRIVDVVELTYLLYDIFNCIFNSCARQIQIIEENIYLRVKCLNPIFSRILMLLTRKVWSYDHIFVYQIFISFKFWILLILFCFWRK